MKGDCGLSTCGDRHKECLCRQSLASYSHWSTPRPTVHSDIRVASSWCAVSGRLNVNLFQLDNAICGPGNNRAHHLAKESVQLFVRWLSTWPIGAIRPAECSLNADSNADGICLLKRVTCVAARCICRLTTQCHGHRR